MAAALPLASNAVAGHPTTSEGPSRIQNSSDGLGVGGSGQVSAAGPESYQVTAANSGVKIHAGLADVDEVSDSLVYTIGYKDSTVVHQSRLGLDFTNAKPMNGNFEIIDTETRHDQKEWSPPYGEQARISDSFTELTLSLRETVTPHRRLDVTFRAYDEGAAFRYTIPDQQGFGSESVVEEQTEFSLPADSTVYAAYANAEVDELTLQQLGDGDYVAPASISYTDDGVASCLIEAAVDDYQPLEFDTLDRNTSSVVTDVSVETSTLPFSTPWRGFVIGADQGEVFKRNHLMLNLNKPSIYNDHSWIEPGKVIRITPPFTTERAKSYVDFAVEHNLQYVHFDTGWYGSEFSEDADPGTVAEGDVRKYPPEWGIDATIYVDMDIETVTAYAHEHDVDVSVYVNEVGLDNYDLDDVFSTYEEWGIDAIKPGFVSVDSQSDISQLIDQIQKAGKYKLVVDIHDNYFPSGLQRTYPNLMTMESIAGDETSPSTTQNIRAAFNRLVAGPTDHTWMYDRDQPATSAHQLAGPVVYYSPLQYLYWYDGPEKYESGNYPELEFWDAVPATWDDTEVLLSGEMDDYISVARQSGDDWFVGTLTDENARDLIIPLDFLNQAKNFVAHVYEDDPELNTEASVAIDRVVVDEKTKSLTASLIENGGQAIHLEPAGVALSFDKESWQGYFSTGEPTEISITATNEMRVPVQNGQTVLETPDGWQVNPVSSTESRTLPPGKTLESTWEVTPSEDADLNDYELSAVTSYEPVRDRQVHQSNTTLSVETPGSTNLSFDFDQSFENRLIESGETREINATLTNTFRFPITDVELDLEVPDNWSVDSISETSFDEVVQNDAVSASWSVTAPSDVEDGDYSLTVSATYTEANDLEQVTDQLETELVIPPAPPSSNTYLSDHDPVHVDVHSALTIDESYDGNPIQIGGTTYEHGLGTHATSEGAEVIYYLDSRYSMFSAVVGIDDETGERGSCAFEVWGDGDQLHRTSTLTGTSKPESFEIDISGVNVLKLVTTDGGDGISYDHGTWALPYVTLPESNMS